MLATVPDTDGTLTGNKIGTLNGLTVDAIESFNKLTWGWAGCQNLQIGQAFCLSSGSPPMPAANPNAICGPQVPGTQPPADMSKLADLNPCPLNACCNIWGQCGTTNDFCTIAKSATGNPGTGPPGSNACISNCGTAIHNNDHPPQQFRRVGYFEAWNTGRPCLRMDVSQIDSKQYDYVHFGFGELTPDYKVDVSDVKDQLESFKKQTGYKKIISFGGWSFSTDEGTFTIFRQGATAANRDAFAQNVADFVHANNLDGVDFVSTYPP